MGWLTTVRCIFMLVLATLVVAAPAQADGRWASTELTSNSGYWNSSGATSAAFQPDGKIVVAGGTYAFDDRYEETFAAIALVRYNPDLSLDASFSQDGKLTTEVDAERYAGGSAVMVQPDGKILVAGSTGRSPSGDFVLVRYRTDGSLDSSFGTGGIVTTDFGLYERANAAVLQPDGKIVVLGESFDMGAYGWPWLALARYRSDGSLDPSFSGDGMLTLSTGDSSASQALALQGDGKLVVGGGSHMLRFEPDGSPDPSFGTAGVVNDSALSAIMGLGIQPDGRIVSAAANGRFAFARYLPDGSLDWSFGIGGRQSIDYGEYGASLNGIAVHPTDGNIAAVGEQYWSEWISGNYGTNLLAAGLNADGALATWTWDWGNPPGGQEQGATAAAFGPDGSIVIVGYGSTYAPSGWPNRFLVAHLDVAAPVAVATITGGPSGTTPNTAPAFTFTGSEPGSTFECRLDGPGTATGHYATCTSPQAYTALADGSYTFRVRATDAAGNPYPEPASQSFTVDTVPPASTITGGPQGPFGFSTAMFSFASENGATFECKLDGPTASGYASCTSPKVYGGLADGNYTFSVRASRSGLTEATSRTQSFTVDTVSPDVTITAGPSGTTTERTPQFAFTSSGPIDHWDCALAGPGLTPVFAPCTSPRTLGPLANGSYTFMVRGTDAAGNATTATRPLTIAADPPDTSITGGPPGATNGTAPSFTFIASAAGSTFECKLDTPSGPGSYSACTSPRAYTTTVNGAYTFSVRASGPGGTDTSPATRSFTVDTAAPETTITSGPTPSFTFTSSEANSTFACKLATPSSAGSYAPCTSPQAYTTPTPGSYTFSVRATDVAGNIDATPATRSFTVATPPSPTPSPGPGGCVGTNGGDVQIPDLSTVESPITTPGCAGNASATAAVEVHIVHTYIGDLVVTLVAPDGSTYLLHNRAGGSADNIDQTYTLNLSSEQRNGTWKLRVQDASALDIGRIDSWTLSL
jgi:uncharacterized delta-60 repeat protein